MESSWDQSGGDEHQQAVPTMRIRRTIGLDSPHPRLRICFELHNGRVHGRVLIDHFLVQIVDGAVGFDVERLQSDGELIPATSWLTDRICVARARSMS